MRRDVAALTLAVLWLAGCGSSGNPIVFRDDFSDVHSGWYEGNDQSSSERYANGRFRIAVREEGHGSFDDNDLERTVDAVSVTAVAVEQAGISGDEIGIFCAAANRPRFTGYFFAVGPGDRFVGIWRDHARTKTDKRLVEKLGVDAVEGRGALQHLRADCTGARKGGPAHLALYVNDTLVAEATDPGGYKRFNRLGLYLSSHNGKSIGLFDDVVAREVGP